MERRITVAEYLGMPETNKPQELTYGILREPPAPLYGHQAVVIVSPMDVVLDRERALVVQPDIIFVSADRVAIIDKQIWGPPDLVVEVLSPGTAKREGTRKLEWYRQYGVKECWLVDDHRAAISVVRLDASESRTRTYRDRDRLYSRVLPGFRPSVARLMSPGG